MPSEAEERGDVFVPHDFEEHRVDLGEIRMNYATAGDLSKPALLLIPGQTESWWGYEQAMHILAEHFQVWAVDLRGQGRSTWTPGRYTLDNMGNDLVRFLSVVVGRPAVVSGLSSGGVLSAWLSAYALRGQVLGAVYEDPPLFASETTPERGPSIRQAAAPMFALWSKYLGDQWSVGDWSGMRAASAHELPDWMAAGAAFLPDEPPQTLKEYDPEWGRAFWSGTVAASCDHARMLAGVRVPVLFTHHSRTTEPKSGALIGAITDEQVQRVRELIEGAGQRFDYRSFPEMGHPMHSIDPKLYSQTVIDWVPTLPD
jgi:pimeloyl-ACP methyl ester carboxylesterase